MRIFLTGATGYIGGSVAERLISTGHEVHGLVRSSSRAADLEKMGIVPVLGSLEDGALLADQAREADAVVNTASADHHESADAMLEALEESGKAFLHTSGSSIVGTRAKGEPVDDVFDEETPFTPSPGREARVRLDRKVLAAAGRGVRAVVICPSLIYGRGRGLKADSIQIPWLIELAKKEGVAKHIGSGGNLWANVHIDDLVDLYQLALEKAPAGAFYFAENGENSMREVCEAISRILGFGGDTRTMSIEEAVAEWGESPANDTMGSNSRVRAVRARKELNWAPRGPSLTEEIGSGCYAAAAGGSLIDSAARRAQGST